MSEKTTEQKLAEAEALLKQLQAEKAEQEKVIAEQHEALKAAETASATPGIVVTHNKVQYQVIAPKFNFEGEDFESEDLKTNKELLKQLVEIKAGILQRIG